MWSSATDSLSRKGRRHRDRSFGIPCSPSQGVERRILEDDPVIVGKREFELCPIIG